MEPADAEYRNEIFGRRFGVLSVNGTSFDALRMSNDDITSIYSIPLCNVTKDDHTDNSTRLLDDNLKYCIPFNCRAAITNKLMDHAGFSDDITDSPSESSDNFQYYLMTPAPTSLDWSAAYGDDACAKFICQQLRINKEPEWTKS